MNARGFSGALLAAFAAVGGVWLVGSCGGSSFVGIGDEAGAPEAGGDGAVRNDGSADGGNPPGCPATQPSGACAGPTKSTCQYGCSSCFCQAGQWQCVAPGCSGGCLPTPPAADEACGGGCCGPSVGMTCDYPCPGGGAQHATCVGGSGGGKWRVNACPPSISNPGKVTCGADECDLSAGQECCDTVTLDAGKQACGAAASGSFCPLGAPQACDEKADCANGNVCCIEFLTQGIGAGCRSTCISGAERYQACKTDAECEPGTGPCALHACRSGQTVRTCTKPVECQ